MQENAERRHTESMILEGTAAEIPVSPAEERPASWSFTSAPLSNDLSLENQRLPFRSSLTNSSSPRPPQSDKPSDMELIKEKFAKLLLGEDMSGGGKGVSSALALSNAITNLAASVFGEQKRLEPMSPEMRARWRKEIDWLLSVTDYIVEMVPVKQKSKDGTNMMEVMTTRKRNDLNINIPALRKLDTMLTDCLDNFKGQVEFSYVSKDGDDKEKNRTDERWWIPTPKVPPDGLSDVTRKWLQFQKDAVNQVHKAAMAINAEVLLQMQIPENYIDSLPKNGRASLGDSIYKGITDDYFDPNHFLSNMDLTSEHKILDLKNRIEASIVIWRRKMNAKDGKSSWSSGVSGVSLEKREIFEVRAEVILHIIKHQFPGIPQSSLDISKIQFNRDVGQAILESYSRIIESLAFTVMSRIEDVLQADSMARNLSAGEQKKSPTPPVLQKFASVKEEIEKLNSLESPASMTLLDYIGWSGGEGDTDQKIETEENMTKDGDLKAMSKPANIAVNKKISYIERLEHLGGCRSPTARH